MGEYVESELIDLRKFLYVLLVFEFSDSFQQNREYAVSQLTDLHQKLAKAESAVAGTKATLPNLKEINGKGKEGDSGTNTKVSIVIPFLEFCHMKLMRRSCSVDREEEGFREPASKERERQVRQLLWSLQQFPSKSDMLFACSSTKIAIEAQHGLIAQVIKDVIFSMRPRTTPPDSGAGPDAGTGTAPNTANTNVAQPVLDAVDSSMALG